MHIPEQPRAVTGMGTPLWGRPGGGRRIKEDGEERGMLIIG